MFGLDEKNKVRDRFCFPANNLVVTSIDIQSVEPVDQRTRDALQKSVQLAIEITTNSQEAAARYIITNVVMGEWLPPQITMHVQHFFKIKNPFQQNMSITVHGTSVIHGLSPSGMKPRGLSRKPKVLWKDRRSQTKQKRRSHVRSCWSCRLTVLQWSPLGRPRLKLSLAPRQPR